MVDLINKKDHTTKMALFYLNDDDDYFPSISDDDDELIAIGGDLSSKRLLSAYRQGIFPWFSSDEQPVCWYSLNPRLVLYPHQLHVSTSMRKLLKKGIYTVRLDFDFSNLVKLCQTKRSAEPNGTWITNKMIAAYSRLHDEGLAHSCEVYNKEQQLVGGFYGIIIGSVFCGESMVSLEPNSSKYALIKFTDYFKEKGLSLIDCQQPTHHMISMGATAIERSQFLTFLKAHRDDYNWRGDWQKMFSDFS